MIVIEKFTHNGRKFKRTYTDSDNTMLRKKGTNTYYDSAVDNIDSKNEYEEVPIPEDIKKRREEIAKRKIVG